MQDKLPALVVAAIVVVTGAAIYLAGAAEGAQSEDSAEITDVNQTDAKICYASDGITIIACPTG